MMKEYGCKAFHSFMTRMNRRPILIRGLQSISVLLTWKIVSSNGVFFFHLYFKFDLAVVCEYPFSQYFN
ncbi:unnamed protein product [Anisakis simplex]|uniref:Ovule protein n=1 Tax=Anisakis simplex TaxID=6269 RepID=A0A0M3JMJ6_ANISI|nr:unnamed protein product [Anisakis simplex]